MLKTSSGCIHMKILADKYHPSLLKLPVCNKIGLYLSHIKQSAHKIKMPPKRTLLHYTRYTHLYLGVFISPALLFFAFTGALQTFSFHETTRGSSYKPPAWIATLAQVHKKQNMTVPVKKLQPLPVQTAKPGADKSQPPVVTAKPHNAMPLKLFFLVVSVGLFNSTISGIYMSYRYVRNKPLITSLLIAGTILPIVLAFL